MGGMAVGRKGGKEGKRGFSGEKGQEIEAKRILWLRSARGSRYAA